jgi:hypothetical protein
LEISGHPGTYSLINTVGQANDDEVVGVFDVGVVTGVRTLTFTATDDPWTGQASYGQALISEIALFQYGCYDDPDCDDGEYCNGSETCVDSVCQAGTPVDCDDIIACTDDTCDEMNDTCVNTPNDSNCDDGEYCNGTETCDGVTGCQAGTAPDCSDSVACTDDTCDEVNDTCVNTPNDANCDDGEYCSGTESCDAVAGCQAGTPVDCGDSVACTDDVCDEANDTCVNTPNDANCDDGEYCNGAETCDAAHDCQASASPCTADQFCNDTSDMCCSGANGSILTATFPTSMPPGTSATPPFVSLPGGATLLDYVDIGEPDCEAGHNMLVLCSGSWPGTGDCFDGSGDSWGPIVTWGGESDGGRAVWENGTAGLTSESATLTMDFGDAPGSKYVAIRWLDGQASDAFSMTISGEATTYVLDDDAGDTEIWEDLGVWDVGAVTGVRTITLQATSAAWSGQPTYGQVTLSEIAVFRGECDNDGDCNDGLWCNGIETCVDSICQAGTAPDCDDAVACTGDMCDELNDECVNDPNDAYCDDDDICTDDSCDSVAGCINTPRPLINVTATVQLDGVVGPVTRCIEFTAKKDATACAMSVSEQVEFAGDDPAEGTVSLNVECDYWTHLCAKDEQHTLSDITTVSIVGDTLEGGMPLLLRGGDTDNDNDVDMNDVTYLIYVYGQGAIYGDCPWNGIARDADFSNNSSVGTEDYALIVENWLEYVDACECARSWTPGEGFIADRKRVQWRIAVNASTIAAKVAVQIDLNYDGVLDVEDVRVFERYYGLGNALSSKMEMTERTLTVPTYRSETPAGSP